MDGLDLPPTELANRITLKTAESEGVEPYASHLQRVIAAHVVSAEPIEGSKNQKAIVDLGAQGKRTVVCGAPNCRAGIVTAYVPPGTSVHGREIRKATINGVESEGMLASGAELEINRDHEGILEIDSLPGESLGLQPDAIIEIDNKSLTHRPDLWGHYGMAREVAAITGKRLIDPVDLSELPTAGERAISVRIEDFDLCPRYSALVFENVTVKPSPLWLQYRLQAIGLNPINNIVDVTNWIMAEIPQPMHAFDADKLQGGITVRSARDGETIHALNGETYNLTSSNLVIADDAGAVAIAGVIGGMESAIGNSTTRIVFESANFHAASVRKTSSALKLRTDASMRFEKSQDPQNTVRGLARAIALLREVSPGIRLVGGLSDEHAPFRTPEPIRLDCSWLSRKLGRAIEPAEVRSILEALQFSVSEIEPEILSVAVPSWRATKDISIADDLVEEIGRMIGYDSIPPTPPLLPAVIPYADPTRTYLRSLRSLIAAQGFHEVYNYSFVSDDLAAQFKLDAGDMVRVLNPIASDQALLRNSLVPGIWKNIGENSKYSDEFRLFEIGREIHRQPGDLPRQDNRLVAVTYFKEADAEGIFELKRLAEAVAGAIEFRPTTARPFEHPARTADVLLDGETIGRVFEFHPSYVRGRASVLELDVERLQVNSDKPKRYTSIRRFPSSAFDLSVMCPARALAGDIEKSLKQFGGDYVESVEFVRQYAGPPLPEGTKSVSFRLTAAAPGRTLSSEETGAIRSQIIERMRELGYDLRV